MLTSKKIIEDIEKQIAFETEMLEDAKKYNRPELIALWTSALEKSNALLLDFMTSVVSYGGVL